MEHQEPQHEELFSTKLIAGSLMTILSIVAVVLGVLNFISFALVAMTLLGLVMTILPYPTPQTVQFFGEERAKIFTRAAGVVLFLAGIIGYLKM
jgi:hypothetical protein